MPAEAKMRGARASASAAAAMASASMRGGAAPRDSFSPTRLTTTRNRSAGSAMRNRLRAYARSRRAISLGLLHRSRERTLDAGNELGRAKRLGEILAAAELHEARVHGIVTA